ncbi:MAG: S41 family peptidase [Clostridia bacterium]
MAEKKENKIIKVIITLIMIVLLGWSVYYIAIDTLKGPSVDGNKASKNNKEINEQLKRVEEVLKKIDSKYKGTEEIDLDKLGEGALRGIFAMIEDPYTRYLDKEDYKDSVTPSNEEYVGIGITSTFSEEKQKGYIISILPESPASESGIWIGDALKKVGDLEVTSYDTYKEAMTILRGVENTTVDVVLDRDGETITKSVTRRKVKENCLTAKTIEKNIGYIRIYSFDFNVADKFKKEYNSFKEQGISKLVIDLRGNPGGIVDEAVEIADLFIPGNDVILETVYKDGSSKFKKAVDGKASDMKVTILTNENSASASEILASALKDYKVATIVGEKTYGKGIVQSYEGLRAGDGVSITVAEYFTKNRAVIHKNGIEPDIEVIATKDEKKQIDMDVKKDSVLRRAIEELNK